MWGVGGGRAAAGSRRGAPFPPFNQNQAYGADAVSFTAAEVAAAPPGPWTVEIFGFGDATEYEARCDLPSPAPATARAHVAALRSVLDDCCRLAGSCPSLRASLHDAAAGGPGPCGVPPNECDAEGRLTTLTLAGDGLACPFPAGVEGLADTIRHLDLSLNELHGSWREHVAPPLAKATRLASLRLSLNRIKGPLTCDLHGKGSVLALVALTQNAVDGGVPACLVEVPVEELHLSGNTLTGRLPAIARGAADTLRVLSLGDQAGEGLTGPLPSFSSAPALTDVRLQSNSLSGELPTDPLPARLVSLDLSNNQFEGKLPSGWGDAVALESLVLDSNRLRGRLPPAIAVAPSLRILSASSAGLEGDLPDSWGPSLVRALLSNNSFTGRLPPSLGGLPALQMLDLSNNELDGDLAAFGDAVAAAAAEAGAASPLRFLSLAANRLSGDVPSTLASIGALDVKAVWGAAPNGALVGKTLNLTSNAFRGPLPAFAVRALADAKDVAVGLADNPWACPPAPVPVRRVLPASAAQGVECERDGGEKVPLANVVRVVGGRDGGDEGREGDGDRLREAAKKRQHDDDDDDDDGDRDGSDEREDEGEGKKERRHGDDDDSSDVDSKPVAAAVPRSHVDPGASGLARPDGGEDDVDREPGAGARHDGVARDRAVEAAQAADAALRAADAKAKRQEEEEEEEDDHHHHAALWLLLAAAAAAAASSTPGRATLGAALARTRGYSSPGGGRGDAFELTGVDTDAFDDDAAPLAPLGPKAKPSGGGIALAARSGPTDDGGSISAYRPPDVGDAV